MSKRITMDDLHNLEDSDEEVAGGNNDSDDDQPVASQGGGGDDEDDEEDEDDEDEVDSEEEEDYGKRKRGASGGKRPKKARSHISSLIQMEAQEEDDEDEDEYRQSTTDKTEEDLAMEAAMKQQDARRARHNNILDDPVDNVVERLKQRTAADRKQEKRYKQLASRGVIGDGSSSLAEVSRVQPTYEDKVYMVKVNGSNKERHAVMSLMNKLIYWKSISKPSAVTSVFCNTTRGVVYIESKSEISVKELVAGMRNLKGYSTNMVPINDLTQVLSIRGVAQRAARLTPGSWVRIKRLPGYKGDIGRVVALTASGVNAIVQLEPRLDYAAIEEEYSSEVNERSEVKKALKEKAKSRPAPPQKPFDSAHLSQSSASSEVSRSRFPSAANIETWRDAHEQFHVFEGNFYLNGFLYKEVNIERQLDTGDVTPSIEQIGRFVKASTTRENNDDFEDEPSNNDDDLEYTELVAKAIESAGSKKATMVSFNRGDKARVIQGDNVGLVGRVVTVDAMQRVVKLEILNLQDQEALAGRFLDFSADDLAKHINQGAHVKVVDGVFAGETGTVVKVDASIDQAFIFTDLVPREIEVRLRDLQESSEVAQGLDELGGYRLYDLVNIENNVAGVVVRVGREDLTVLDTFGVTRSMKPQQIRGSLNRDSSSRTSFDKDGNAVGENSRVTILSGHMKHTNQNIVKRVFKTNVFLYSRERIENAGIVVLRARDTRVLGAVGTASLSENYMGSLGDSGGKGGKGGKGGGKGKGGKGLKPAIVGKTCKIKKGAHKGLIGACTNATNTHVTIALSSRHKTVTLKIDEVVPVDEQHQNHGNGGFGGGPGDSNTWGVNNQMTPYLTGQTPLIGAQTPLHASTPMTGASPGRNEVWQPGVGDTPMHSYDPFDDARSSGGATPRGGAGGFGFDSDEYDPNAAAVGSGNGSLAWAIVGAEVLYRAGGAEAHKITATNASAQQVTIVGRDGYGRDVPVSDLTHVMPQQGDRAFAFYGDYANNEGVLEGSSDDDGILVVTEEDGTQEHYMVQLSDLVKLAEW